MGSLHLESPLKLIPKESKDRVCKTFRDGACHEGVEEETREDEGPEGGHLQGRAELFWVIYVWKDTNHGEREDRAGDS